MKPLIIVALGALLAITSAPAQEGAACPPRNPQGIRTDQTLWKDGGSSLISELTIDGRRVQVLLRLDEKGRLMVAELNYLKDTDEGVLVEQQVKLPTLQGGAEAPYSIFTKADEKGLAWIKDYHDYQGRKVMIEKVDKKTSESTYLSPDHKPLPKEEVDRVFERMIDPKANWLQVSDFRKGGQPHGCAPGKPETTNEQKPTSATPAP